MHINYLEDDDLAFLPECSEAHLEAFTRILTHGENMALQTDFSTRTIRMQTVLEKQPQTRRNAA